MGNRLAAAEAALKAGRPAEAVEQIEAALAESSNRSAQVYRVLARNLYRLDRFVEGAAAVARGLAKHPRDAELWNLRGVMLRKLGRHSEALEALDEAVKIDPRQDFVPGQSWDSSPQSPGGGRGGGSVRKACPQGAWER